LLASFAYHAAFKAFSAAYNNKDKILFLSMTNVNECYENIAVIRRKFG
jgi:hypothetical protein